MRITTQDLELLYGAQVTDRDGERVGGVGHVYLDDASGQPEWVTVRTGWFGARQTFVPLADADFENGIIQVPYGADFLRDAPHVDPGEHPDEEGEERLYRYFGRSPEAGDPVLQDRVVQENDGDYRQVERRGRRRLRRHTGTDQGR